MYHEKDLPSLPRPNKQLGLCLSPRSRPLVTEDREIQTLQNENEDLRRLRWGSHCFHVRGDPYRLISGQS